MCDGITVRIGEHDATEPDALVNRGDPPDDDALEAPTPIASRRTAPERIGVAGIRRLEP